MAQESVLVGDEPTQKTRSVNVDFATELALSAFYSAPTLADNIVSVVRESHRETITLSVSDIETLWENSDKDRLSEDTHLHFDLIVN